MKICWGKFMAVDPLLFVYFFLSRRPWRETAPVGAAWVISRKFERRVCLHCSYPRFMCPSSKFRAVPAKISSNLRKKVGGGCIGGNWRGSEFAGRYFSFNVNMLILDVFDFIIEWSDVGNLMELRFCNIYWHWQKILALNFEWLLSNIYNSR